MQVQLERVTTEEQLVRLAEIASAVWHEYFPCLLTPEQIDYMVEKFQSYPAMRRQMAEEGYEYYFICADGETVGYTGIREDGEKLFLSKLYLTKENRGKGYAGRTLDFLTELCRERGKKAIWLTVNKYNEHTIAVYGAKGFETIRSQVTDIGNGFVMDDYVMEKPVSPRRIS
jgi:GNAT superfamily N-acetyltransferase